MQFGEPNLDTHIYSGGDSREKLFMYSLYANTAGIAPHVNTAGIAPYTTTFTCKVHSTDGSYSISNNFTIYALGKCTVTYG